MRDSGIYNEITLSVVVQSGPDTWDLFVTLPGRSSQSTLSLSEVWDSDLYIASSYMNLYIIVADCDV